MVLSSPKSLGKWFHWQELRIRKMTPSSIFRWSTRLRPFGLGGSNSKITGSIRSTDHLVFPISLAESPSSPFFTTTQLSPILTGPPICSPFHTNPILR